MIYIIIAILGGASIVIARIINADLADKIGTFQGTFYNYITGLIVSFICLLFTKELFHFTPEHLSKVPIWAYFGGLVGVVVVVLSNYITSKTSALYLTLLLFVGQMALGISIDYITLDSVSPGKILGSLCIGLGLLWNLKVDRDKELNRNKNEDLRA